MICIWECTHRRCVNWSHLNFVYRFFSLLLKVERFLFDFLPSAKNAWWIDNIRVETELRESDNTTLQVHYKYTTSSLQVHYKYTTSTLQVHYKCTTSHFKCNPNLWRCYIYLHDEVFREDAWALCTEPFRLPGTPGAFKTIRNIELFSIIVAILSAVRGTTSTHMARQFTLDGT